MIKYPDIDTAIQETNQRVRSHGKKKLAGIWQAIQLFQDHEMYVLTNEFFEIPIQRESHLALAWETMTDMPWAEDHFQERISGIPSNPGETYKDWPYHSNLDNSPFKDDKFSHTYQERFWPRYAKNEPNHVMQGIRYEYGDLNDVIRQLRDNPLTRQAYLPIFFPEDTGAVHKQRVPCTLGYYFYIEDNQLHMNYIIRSCDILRHFRNDIYLSGRLLQYVSSLTGYQVGKLNFMCFNLHLFVNDEYAFIQKEKKLRDKKQQNNEQGI